MSHGRRPAFSSSCSCVRCPERQRSVSRSTFNQVLLPGEQQSWAAGGFAAGRRRGRSGSGKICRGVYVAATNSLEKDAQSSKRLARARRCSRNCRTGGLLLHPAILVESRKSSRNSMKFFRRQFAERLVHVGGVTSCSHGVCSCGVRRAPLRPRT